MGKLAINGGKPTVPEGFIKNWPPIDEIDRKFREIKIRMMPNAWESYSLA